MRLAPSLRPLRGLRWALLALVACEPAEAQNPVEAAASCPRLEDGVWESAPWPPASMATDSNGALTCPWLRFEGRTTYRLGHALGRTPRQITIYLSFDEDGSSSAIGAGDSARIIGADETAVQLRNGTNQEFFLRAVLQ